MTATKVILSRPYDQTYSINCTKRLICTVVETVTSKLFRYNILTSIVSILYFYVFKENGLFPAI